ncbi:Fungal specific transcription factor domain family protein [Aspergillus niger]|uniref:Fungal specific transcription factor domain family protein n=1 Tax=Aspergillus niger TaxID=5061 RepID=A0A505HSY5_ASPNG|nr:Fungal specific transcription factor domain family protein [Aspergillus niger]
MPDVIVSFQTSPRYGDVGCESLPGDSLAKFAGSLIEILTKARILGPAQLADVLQRARRVNAIQSWAVNRGGEVIACSHPTGEENNIPATTYENIRITGDQLTSYGDALPRSRTQPDRIEPRIDMRKAWTTSLATPSVAQTPGEGSEGPINHGTPLHLIPDRIVGLSRKAFMAPENGQWLRRADFEQVLRLSARLIDPAPRTVLEPLLDSWHANVSQGLHALGLPLEWIGVEAAATYAIMLKNNMVPDAVGQRAARMLLVLNYEEMCQFPECYCPRPRRAAEQKKAYVMNCIAHACVLGDPSKSERDLIHNYLRQGRWLWVIASIVGLGFALTCSEELMSAIKNVSITNNGINTLATHAFYARPAMVALLHSLESAVAHLMLGKISRSLCEAIQDDSGILGQSALLRMNEVDQVHQNMQHAGHQDPIDLDAVIQNVKNRILANLLETQLALKHDPPLRTII